MLAIRGGVLQGRAMTADEVESLATLPPVDVLRGQVLGAIIAPVTALAGLAQRAAAEPVGLIDARIEQLGGEAATRRRRRPPEPRRPRKRRRPPRRPRAEEEPAAEEAPSEHRRDRQPRKRLTSRPQPRRLPTEEEEE